MEKQAFEPTGLIPRSIIRTVDRFVQQLLPGKEKIALQEYRVSRYQILVSIKSLLTLILIPLLVSSTIKALIFTPLVEHFWNNNQNEIFLNQYQERRAFSEMHDFSEKMFFESLLIEPKSRPMVIETENFDHIVKTLNAPEMKNQKYMSKASDLFENQKSVGVANCTKDFEFTVCPHNYSHKHEFSYKNYPVVCHIRGNASSIYENTPSFPLTLPLPGNQEPQRSSMCMPCLSPLLTNQRKNLLDFLPYSQIFVRCTYVQTPLGQKQISHKHKSSLPLFCPHKSTICEGATGKNKSSLPLWGKNKSSLPLFCPHKSTICEGATGKNKSSHKSSICACACVANLRFARACEKICEAPSLPTQIHKSTNQRFDFPPSQIYTQISDLCLYSDLCRNLCLWENKPLVQGDEFINYSKQKQRLQIENIKLQLNAFSFALPYTESSLDYPIRNTVNSYKQNYLSNIPKIQNLEMRIPSAPKTHKHKEGFIPFVPVTLPFMSQQQWDYPHKHNYPRNIQFVNKEEESNFALENLHFVNFENDKYQTLFQLKSLELAKSYNKQSILAITNLLGDFLTFFTVSLLFRIMRPELIILKSFLTESVYSLSDTTKSFLLILGMDLLVGFHSPRGWELLLEGFLRHIGLPENENFILLFVALFPVFLDTVFKYWIFRYLNKISPSTVVTYHSMIE